MSFRHDVRAVVAVHPRGQEFLGVLHAVDVQVAAGNLNRIARQTHHALDKIRTAAVRIAAHHDIKALRLAAQHNRLIEEVRRAVMQLAHHHDFAVVQRRIHAVAVNHHGRTHERFQQEDEQQCADECRNPLHGVLLCGLFHLRSDDVALFHHALLPFGVIQGGFFLLFGRLRRVFGGGGGGFRLFDLFGFKVGHGENLAFMMQRNCFAQ